MNELFPTEPKAPEHVFTTEEKIFELKREQKMRNKVYPNWLRENKYPPELLRKQQDILANVIYDYEHRDHVLNNLINGYQKQWQDLNLKYSRLQIQINENEARGNHDLAQEYVRSQRDIAMILPWLQQLLKNLDELRKY